jgi:hypothetical protein
MSSLWIALLQALKAAFEFASNLVKPTTSEVDAEAQRAGTAAGAAANHASHLTGKSSHDMQSSKGDDTAQ